MFETEVRLGLQTAQRARGKQSQVVYFCADLSYRTSGNRKQDRDQMSSENLGKTTQMLMVCHLVHHEAFLKIYTFSNTP